MPPDQLQTERSPDPRLVLIVDDDETSGALFAEVLRESGCVSRLATSGEAALRCLATESPAVIVVDSQLPGMTGLEFVRRARQALATGCPIIGLSGFEPGAPCNAEFESAVTEYHEKSDSLDSMSRIVLRHLA